MENRKTFLEHKTVYTVYIEIHTFIHLSTREMLLSFANLSKNTISNVLLYSYFWKFYVITETIMHYLQYQEHRNI